MTSPRAPDPDRLGQAAAWRARLAMAQAPGHPELDQWLAADPRNREAWEASRAAWSVFDLDPADPAALAARAMARSRTGSAPRRRTPPVRAWAAAAILAIGLGLAVHLAHRPDVYQTGLGERREVALADGSRVALDADTRLEARLTRDRRDLTLVRGQARFAVAPDKARPFAVVAHDHRVVALGTRFNIDLIGPATRVTLIEGRITVQGLAPRRALLPAADLGAPMTLRPGQQFADDQTAPAPAVAAVDVSKATAWESGQLVFEEEPLGQVAARVSRYSKTRIEVVGADLAARRISGVFKAGDLPTFLDAVQRHLGLEAVSAGQDHITLRRPAG